jgi:imidazolonepropionase-like amidohydrolase
LTVVRAARLFDGVSPSLVPAPLVVVDGRRIVGVRSGGDPPEGADVVVLPQATLMPGLVDAHVHLAFDASTDPVAALAARDTSAVVSSMRAAAATALVGGVTTVRDLGDRDYLALGLRDDVDLPTILAAGPPITSQGGHCYFLGGQVDDDPQAMQAAVQARIDRGADVVKIMGSGGNLTPGSSPERGQFSLPTLRAGVEAAHRHGLPVAVHAHGTAAIRDAVAAGADSIEHATFWSADGVDAPSDLIDQIVARRVTIAATVGVRPGAPRTPYPESAARTAGIVTALLRLYHAGARFIATSDAGIHDGKPHDVARHIPAALAAIGLSRTEGLRLVTSAPADACDLTGRKGRLAPGYDADILAVDGDPTTDPTAMDRIVAVFATGRRIR